MYLQLSILPTFAITILQKTIGYQIQCSVFGILLFSPMFNILFKFNDSKYNSQGLIFGGGGGGLYMEGIFHFNISWFLNTPGLYTVGLINYRGFTVFIYIK